MKKFKERLKELRVEADLTQKALAMNLGLSMKTINHYENGYSEPNLDILIALCNFFEISADYLLGITDI